MNSPPEMSAGRLAGRVAVITGAGRGIGREIALGYASEGAAVVAAARTPGELNGVVREIAELGSCALAVETDVSVESNVQRLVERTLETFGSIDILVNNAGITPGAADGPIKSMLDVSTNFWDATFATNCRGPFLCIRAVLPTMIARRRGVILSITSRLAANPVAGNAPYGPSKAALDLLTRIVDSEFSSAGIRANLLHPGGPVATTIFNDYYKPMPGSMVGSPADVRPAAIWLASDVSSAVHGEIIDAREWLRAHGAELRPEGEKE